jgi:adenylosuccinate synthase
MASVTVVVGGQYGSEGKGKVAQYLAREQRAAIVVRVGGSNSGHTGFAENGELHVFRQLPTAALLPDPLCVIGPGSYIDPPVLLAEIERARLAQNRLLVDEKAFVITPEDKEYEEKSGLIKQIGSTGSGTGGAVRRRIERRSPAGTVKDVPELAPYLGDASERLRNVINAGERVVVEGTQGFGLSVLHSPHYPRVTTRDTTAAAAIAEAGLSPLDVDQVVLVIRTFPIRVAGDSGHLPREIDWPTVTAESGSERPLEDLTSVTGRVRRVGRFDSEIVRRAIAVNLPSMIVMNHIDYVDARCSEVGSLTERARRFISETSEGIGAPIDLVGLGPAAMVSLSPELARAAS